MGPAVVYDGPSPHVHRVLNRAIFKISIPDIDPTIFKLGEGGGPRGRRGGLQYGWERSKGGREIAGRNGDDGGDIGDVRRYRGMLFYMEWTLVREIIRDRL